jgi:hypothetical protein
LTVIGENPGLSNYTECSSGGTCSSTCRGSESYQSNFGRQFTAKFPRRRSDPLQMNHFPAHLTLNPRAGSFTIVISQLDFRSHVSDYDSLIFHSFGNQLPMNGSFPLIIPAKKLKTEWHEIRSRRYRPYRLVAQDAVSPFSRFLTEGYPSLI